MSAAPDMQPRTRDLVLGLGATGLSVARHFQRVSQDAAVFVDTREQPPGLDELLTLMPDADIECGTTQLPANVGRVIASPGLSDRDPLVTAAITQGIPVVSDIELFMSAATAPVTGITGSNGKSTVTTLINAMCAADGKRAYAGGNLGRPALDLLSETNADCFVLELSSFQLQRTTTLPLHVAVLLNVSADHLDWHADFDEYAAAKYRIFSEADAVVFNATDARAVELASNASDAIGVTLGEPGDDEYGIRRDNDQDYLARGATPLFAVEQLAMVGRHNQFNALAAMAACELMGVSQQAMLEVLCEFPGLPHRMQRVARIASVDYINDSKATNVAAAIASIESIDGQIVLIAGGDGKGGDFSLLRPALGDRLRLAVLLGKDAQEIAAALGPNAHHAHAQDMQQAVTLAAQAAEYGDTVLLAPACASLDQFSGYAARGDAFASAVRGLAA